jgi:hypothetical protein
MPNLTHADVGTQLSYTEYHSESGHVISGGLAGDMLYFNGTAMTRLPIDADNKILTIRGGIPAWVDDPIFTGGLNLTNVMSIEAQSHTAFTVARLNPNYAFQVDTDAADSISGLRIVAGTTFTALDAISNDLNPIGLVINAKGTGSISLNSIGTGDIFLNRHTVINAGGLSVIGSGISASGGISNVGALATALVISRVSPNYALQVDTSSANSVNGVKIVATDSGVMLNIVAISPDINASLDISAKGSGVVSLGANDAGSITLNSPTSIPTGGLTVSGKAVGASLDAGNALVWNANGFYVPISASNLDSLTDVIISSPLTNQVLAYNGTQWVNQTSPAGVTTLDGLSDVTISSPLNTQVLTYNGTQWVNASPGAVGATDIDMTSHIITNIGNANTDFVAGGGLNLAGVLNVSVASVTTIQSWNNTDPGAIGVQLATYHNSVSPNGGDVISQLIVQGNSSTAVLRNYGILQVSIQSAINASEGSLWTLQTMQSGTLANALQITGGSGGIQNTMWGGFTLQTGFMQITAGYLQIVNNTSGSQASIYKTAADGLALRGVTGTTNDYHLFNSANLSVMRLVTGTQTIIFSDTVGITGNLGLNTPTPRTMNGLSVGDELVLQAARRGAGTAHIAVDNPGIAGIKLNDSSQIANSRTWALEASAGLVQVSTYTDAGVGTGRLFINRNGHIGIGQTPRSTWPAADDVIQFQNTRSTIESGGGVNNSYLEITTNMYYDSVAGSYKNVGDGPYASFEQLGNGLGHRFLTGASPGPAGTSFNPIERVLISDFGIAITNGYLQCQNSAAISQVASIRGDAEDGLTIRGGQTGLVGGPAVYDLTILNTSGSRVMSIPTATVNVQFAGTITATNFPGNLDSLTDVVVTTPANGHVLTYNGTAWVNQVASGGAGNLDSLTDVTITSALTNQVLQFNGTAWVNTTTPVLIRNLGLGAAPVAWAASWYVTDYSAGKFAFGTDGSAGYLIQNAYYDGSTWRNISNAPCTMFNQSAGGTFQLYTAPSTGGTGLPVSWTERMRLELGGNLLVYTGNVGLGGAPLAWNTNYRVIDFGAGVGSIMSGYSANHLVHINCNFYYDTGGVFRNVINAALSGIQVGPGVIYFYTNPSPGAAGTSFTPAMRMRIDTNGAVQFECNQNATNAFTIRNLLATSNTTLVVWNDQQNKYVYLNTMSSAFPGNGAISASPGANTTEIVANQPLFIGTNVPSNFHLCTNATIKWYLESGGNLLPFVNGGPSLGDTGHRVLDVWCTRGAFNGSHSSLKRDWQVITGMQALEVARSSEIGMFKYNKIAENDFTADWQRVGILADYAHKWLSPDGYSVNAQDTACIALAAVSGVDELITRQAEKILELEKRLASLELERI